MKASEFRIGNYYNQFGNAEKVSWSTLKTLEESTTEQLWCKPIPLTEEWLEKLGFECLYTDDEHYFYIDSIRGFYVNSNFQNIDCEYDLKYVHQLQNLYFALTNEELTYEQQK